MSPADILRLQQARSLRDRLRALVLNEMADYTMQGRLVTYSQCPSYIYYSDAEEALTALRDAAGI